MDHVLEKSVLSGCQSSKLHRVSFEEESKAFCSEALFFPQDAFHIQGEMYCICHST